MFYVKATQADGKDTHERRERAQTVESIGVGDDHPSFSVSNPEPVSRVKLS